MFEGLKSKFGSGGGEKIKEPNFPVCYPIIYHNLLDIPTAAKKTYTIASFFLWISTCVVILLNAVGMIINMVALPDRFLVGMLISFVFVLFFWFFLFFMQYWAAYSATVNSSSIRWILVFCADVVIIIFCVLGVLGIRKAGFSGILSGVDVAAGSDRSSAKSKVAMAWDFIFIAVWAVLGLAHVLKLIVGIRFFKEDKHSLSSARNKVITNFAAQSLSI